MSDSLSDEEALDLWNKKGKRAAKQTGTMSDKEALALWEKVRPPEAPQKGPSTGRAAAEGALQGGTYGFGDELQGLIGAVLRRSPGMGMPTPEEMGEENIFSPSGHGGTFTEDYRMERDAARRDRQAAETAHPDAYGGSQLAAAILTPGPKAGKGIDSFAKAGAKVGGAYGLGASDADLTKGEVGDAAIDTAVGTGLGAATGAVAGGLNKFVVQPIAGKVSQMGANAAQRGRDLANKPIDAAVNSASGKVGGQVSAGRNAVANLRQDAVDASLPEDLSRRAAELLDDPGAAALNERVARSTQGQFFQRLPNIDKADAALDEALEGATPKAREAAYEAFMEKSPLKRALWEIAKRTAPTVAGSAIGGALGGTAGAGVGGTLGLLTGAMSGRPGRIMTNAIRSPQFQRSAAQGGTRLLEESIPGALEGVVGEESGNPQSMLRGKLEPWLELLREREE